MAIDIHPSAIVERGAELADDVVVGAYSHVGELASIGAGTVVSHHVTVDGRTQIGERNVLHPYSYVGAPTHDLKYSGGEPGLKVGNGNVFREYCTMHVATKAENETLIGNGNVFLAYAHVGHDCIVGNGVIMSSQAALGGHVTLGDFANIGWNSGIHQFCRVGKYAMVGASAKATQDIPPYMLADGIPAKVRCPNFVNLRRRGFSEGKISQIKEIFKIFYLRKFNRMQAMEIMMNSGISSDLTDEILNFAANSIRGFA
ncbi:MAG: acyl-ACP--UDP-N-acetylglucosamine O-acyltransferase [Puniceicoccales bacterium]|jgi:UDP-N-acetylglucosamine acyltransferase|nr:acyl-ACP--UDP-N-acetylglucosamine O-acyltransferase [Puniceicoccales bacterium]